MRLRLLPIVTIVLLLLSLVPVLAASPDPLLNFHINNGEIHNLNRVADSHLYGKGQDLTKIYDGGVDRYMKAGVVEASQLYYSRGKNSAEMVILRLKSAKHAQAFYSEWKNDMGKGISPVAFPKSQPANGITCVMQGMTYGYAYTNSYLITVTLDAKDAGLVADMMKRTVSKILR